jgi:hypothetical protein
VGEARVEGRWRDRPFASGIVCVRVGVQAPGTAECVVEASVPDAVAVTREGAWSRRPSGLREWGQVQAAHTGQRVWRRVDWNLGLQEYLLPKEP